MESSKNMEASIRMTCLNKEKWSGLCSDLGQNSRGEAQLGESGRGAARDSGELWSKSEALSENLPMFFKGKKE